MSANPLGQEEENCAMCRDFETAAMQKTGHPPVKIGTVFE
jgi:hypothetical protein